MPFGGLLSLGTSLFGAGSSLAGLLGGNSASQVQIPQAYQYQNSGGADANAYSGIGALGGYNVPAQYLPQYQDITQSIVNNPYAQLYQGGANNQAYQYGTQGAASAFGAGQGLTNTAMSSLPDVNALLSLGFDPQNALYSRTLQQVQDQTRAAEGVRGIAMSPYGAGIENTATNNFNIDWQNNQLQRGVQGAQGAGGLLNNAAGGATAGAGLQAGAVPLALQGAGAPYNTFNNINTTGLQALSGAGQFGQQAAQLPQQQIADYLQYLSGGTGATQAGISGANTGLNQANLAFNQSQTLGNQFGSSLAGLSRGFNGNQNPFSNIFGGGGGTGPNFQYGAA